MYSRFDAVGIALENRLDITVKEALAFKSQGGPMKVSLQLTFFKTFEFTTKN